MTHSRFLVEMSEAFTLFRTVREFPSPLRFKYQSGALLLVAFLAVVLTEFKTSLSLSTWDVLSVICYCHRHRLSLSRSLSFYKYIYIHTHTHIYIGDRGNTVVKVLCYKSEGRSFDPSLCQWIFH